MTDSMEETVRTNQEGIQHLLSVAKQTATSKTETYTHAVIVLFVLASATALRAAGDLDTATISTVYGAALGYATGLTVRRRNGGS